MLLLTKKNLRALPPLYSQDGKGADAIAHVKFFGGGRFTYYVTECDATDDGFTFYGYMLSPLGPDCDEWGYVTSEQLAAMRFPIVPGTRPVLPVERDRYFDPAPVRECPGVRL